MSNPIVEGLRTQIGKQIKSPSPAMKNVDGTMVEVEIGKVAIDISVTQNLTNPIGTLHGGITALLVDDIIGAAIYTLDEDVAFATVNLYVDYLAPAQLGDVLRVEAKIIRDGKTIKNAECTISKGDKLIAKGASNLMRTRIPIK